MFLGVVKSLKNIRKRCKLSYWSQTRKEVERNNETIQCFGWDLEERPFEVVVDSEWKENFRMIRQSFLSLCLKKVDWQNNYRPINNISFFNTFLLVLSNKSSELLKNICVGDKLVNDFRISDIRKIIRAQWKHFISERFETLCCLAVSIKKNISTFRSVSERFLSGIVETWSNKNKGNIHCLFHEQWDTPFL